MDADYFCLCCEAFYHTNKHRCTTECRVDGNAVLHFDFCKKCRELKYISFENQFRKPRLRTENP